MEKLPTKKRLLWIDMAKGLAIVLVVMGHCLSDTTGLHDLIYSFHMPLFFALAGYTMHAKRRKTVLVTSARRLLVPYVVVCCIMIFFAFVPPVSINSNLDTQRPLPVVLVEAFYASGQEGQIYGHTFQAIGAIWFLPCLFWARLMLNEILLHTEGHDGAGPVMLQMIAVGFLLWLGFAIGNQIRLPFDIDTAMVAVFFMYVGYLAKRVDLKRVPWWMWVVLIVVWLLYTQAGKNEMAIRAYLLNPYSLVTAAAGSLVIMKLCMSVEGLGEFGNPVSKLVQLANKGFAWMGVASLTILCVHRVESAIFNWQKIMEFFAPDVWNWDVLYQGLYQFCLRYALVLVCSIVVVAINKGVRGLVASKRGKRPAKA